MPRKVYDSKGPKFDNYRKRLGDLAEVGDWVDCHDIGEKAKHELTKFVSDNCPKVMRIGDKFWITEDNIYAFLEGNPNAPPH